MESVIQMCAYSSLLAHGGDIVSVLHIANGACIWLTFLAWQFIALWFFHGSRARRFRLWLVTTSLAGWAISPLVVQFSQTVVSMIYRDEGSVLGHVWSDVGFAAAGIVLLIVACSGTVCMFGTSDRGGASRRQCAIFMLLSNSVFAAAVSVLYLRWSDISLATSVGIIPRLADRWPNNVIIVFINDDTNDVYSVNPVNHVVKPVCKIDNDASSDARLYGNRTADGDMVDLWLNNGKGTKTKIFTHIGRRGTQDRSVRMAKDGPTSRMFGEGMSLETSDDEWEIQSGIGALEGVRWRRRKDGVWHSLALRSPVHNESIRNITYCGSSLAVLQVGERDIVLLDLQNEITMPVEQGRGPTVVEAD